MARNTVKANIGAPHLRVLAPLLFAAVACASSVADEWDYSTNIYTGLTYTDNVTLAADDGEDEFIWEINPSVVASRDGKRVDFDINYRLQGLLYVREDGRNSVYNHLQSTLRADVVPDLIQFDADASISQTVIDPLLPSGNSSISAGGNSTERLTVNASPYIVHRIGPATELRAGVSAGVVEYDAASLVDSNQRSYFASLANNGGSGLFNWSFGYNSTLVEYDIGREIELARVNGEIGLRIGPRTEFVVSGGEDINDFGSLSGQRVAEGSFWNVGLRGGFGNNIDFDVRFGEQFFGESYGVEFSRTSRALVTSLSYTEAATTLGAQQPNIFNALSLLGLSGGFDNQFDVNGFDLPRSEAEFYIRRRFDFNNTLTSGKSSLRLALFYEDRMYIRTTVEGGRENVQGARFEWGWDYNNATEINTSATYRKVNSRDNLSAPEDFRLSVQAQREMFSNSYVTAMVWRNSRRAPQDVSEYVEHALRIGFGHRF